MWVSHEATRLHSILSSYGSRQRLLPQSSTIYCKKKALNATLFPSLTRKLESPPPGLPTYGGWTRQILLIVLLAWISSWFLPKSCSGVIIFNKILVYDSKQKRNKKKHINPPQQPSQPCDVCIGWFIGIPLVDFDIPLGPSSHCSNSWWLNMVKTLHRLLLLQTPFP